MSANACYTGRCARRLYEGHGTTNYRPTNSVAAKEMENALQRMMAERTRQDGGVFSAPAPAPAPAFINKIQPITTLTQPVTSFYSLSDCNN
jgi:hypothetical protein